MKVGYYFNTTLILNDGLSPERYSYYDTTQERGDTRETLVDSKQDSKNIQSFRESNKFNSVFFEPSLFESKNAMYS